MARLATVTFEAITGMPEDRVVNTFAFVNGAGATTAENEALADGLADLYNAIATGATANIAGRLSRWLSRAVGAASVKLYDIDGNLDGSPHGSPIFEKTFTLAAASAVGELPHEVAIAVRLEAIGRSEASVETVDGPDADTLPDRLKQRLTGRVYFGPFTDEVVAGGTASLPVRPATTALDALRQNMAALMNASFPVVLGSPMRLGVWSRQNQAVVALEAVATDNAFDTVRRRGVAPSALTRSVAV